MEEQEKQTEYMRGVPPHDETAEQAVLCSMFLDREAASVALEALCGEDFYRPDHRMVFEAAEELYRSGSPIDVITVKNKLEEKGRYSRFHTARRFISCLRLQHACTSDRGCRRLQLCHLCENQRPCIACRQGRTGLSCESPSFH